MGDGDYHLFRHNKILGQDLVRSIDNLCPALIAIFITNLFKLFPNDLDNQGVIAKHLFQPLDSFDDLFIILDDLVPLQAGQPLQAHV